MTDELFSGVNTNDFEWPWTSKIGGFSVFFNFRLRRTLQKWTAPKLLEIDLDNMRMNFFSIERTF